MADAVWSHVLTDRKWLDWFLDESRRRLGDAAEFTREWFKARGIAVARCNALVNYHHSA
jgi:1-aminocyclopropane-1-carboxylate synthase